MVIRTILFFLTFSFTFGLIYAQQTYSLRGNIVNAENESLAGVNVIIPSLNKGVVTNEQGFYTIRLPKGEFSIQISYLGYSTVYQSIKLKSNTTFNLQLEEVSENLDEVVISKDIERLNIKKPEMSVSRLEISTIQKLPAVFGEVDVIRSLLLLPGVSNAGEGSSGFNVRGGAVDQNLILLDQATIFNASHLFGLFSVFNPDAIKDLKLYKGGIPAKYGGRVSSVLEISQKEGNNKKVEVNGGLGIISSRLLVEGPMFKEKASFLIGGRSSYAHIFLKLIDNPNSAYFYDLNTKLNYKINDRNNLEFSGYFGRDIFNINDSFKNSYGNAVLNLRWNQVINENITTSLSTIYTDYYYGLTLDYVGFTWNSGIKNFNLNYGFNHYINENLNLNYGLQNTYYQFNPGEIEPSSINSGINSNILTKKFALENAVYLSLEQTFSERISVQYGARLSSFFRLGQDELSLYANDQPVRFNEDFGIYKEADPTGTRTLSSGKVEKYFINFEPRFSIAYNFNNYQSVKAGYNRMSQNLHLITNTSSPTPLDVWAPSGRYIKPQLLDQVAVGYFQNSKDDKYSLEIETFYKYIQNRLDYIDGANLIANNAIETVVLPGKARAYGIELLIKKNTGRFTGWIAYTLSKAQQQTPGRTPAETGINNGIWYSTNYDKPHDISITGSYELSNRWQVNSNFIFQSGLPTTYPTGQYRFESLTIPVYSPRNSNRLPSYHRLDISATYTPGNQENRRFESTWNFGIYNVYSRKNTASLSFRRNVDTGENEALRLSLFGIIPSITYNFKF